MSARRTIIGTTLVFGLICAGVVQAQVGSSISSDGATPNNNAMLDVQSPLTGDGKGMLVPRVTLVQRATASSAMAGGLLDDSGNLRGGPAQGLIVYQTDGVQGLYFNTSLTAAPSWAYLGDITGLLASNVWAAAGSTTNYLPRTGGTMSGALNMGAQIVSNVAHIDFNGTDVSVGRGANGSTYGAALGYGANGSSYGAALGLFANGFTEGAALGWVANGSTYGAAVGVSANGAVNGAAMGYQAKGTNSGAAMGYEANGSSFGAAVGYQANGFSYSAAVGVTANGSTEGAALGYQANGFAYGAALGRSANGSTFGAAVGVSANGTNSGVAVGQNANGASSGAAVGGAAKGYNYGVAMGRSANGANTNIAIGAWANAGGGLNRIAIGYQVTNDVDNSASIRGSLYLDGGTNIFWRTNFASGTWSVKTFMIDHPLDPANKVLRHYCLEGPQVWNVYAGNAQLVNGRAIVELPDYYSALNLVGSEIYSLTVVGALAQIAVGTEVNENQFTIIGDKDVKVSWTIKVLRNDPGCLEDLRRRPVEQMKNEIR